MKTLLALLFVSAAFGQLPVQVSNGTTPAGVSAQGALRVSQEPGQLFVDAFDYGLDTVNKWAATAGGTGTAPNNGGLDAGGTTLTSGTTLNSYSLLQTLQVFRPVDPGFIYTKWVVQIEYPVLLTGYRFWGLGSTAATPTLANPIVDGAGFDLGTNGKLYAVTYQGTSGTTGARVVIADLSASTGNNKQPLDGGMHKYFMYYRGDLTYFAIDSLDNVVASFLTGAPGPNNNILPLTAIAVSAAGTTLTINVGGTAVGDTARNTVAVSDGTFPANRQSVCPFTSTFSVASTMTQVVAINSFGYKVKICSASLNPSTITAGSVDLVYGTGTNCGTGTTTLTGAYTLPAAAVVNVPVPLTPNGPLTAPAGSAVCVRTATATVNGFLTWAQSN